MVAVLNPIPSDHLDHFQVQRPALRIISGGRDRRAQRPHVGRLSAATYRRRRAFAALVVLTVVGLTVIALLAASSFVSGVTSARASAAPLSATTPVGAASYVVQPGDTLWAIAAKLAPSGDIRSVVDQLADRQGGSALEAGQRIDLTGLAF